MIAWLSNALRMRGLDGRPAQVLRQESARQDEQADAIRQLRRGLLEEEADLADDERRERRR